MNKELNNILRTNDKVVLLLIGTPLSGKDTFIRDNDLINLGFKTISRDDILMDDASELGITNYSEAFNKVDQKKVDKKLKLMFKDYSKNEDKVIINMTHMGVKRRKANLSYFDHSYHKVAIIFPFLSDKEYMRRNEKRKLEENKDLPMFIVKKMKKSFQEIQETEGFNKIINL